MAAYSEQEFRLIVSDLDGTLLNSDHELTETTARLLDDLIACGTLFTVATGKTYPSTVQHIERFGIAVPVICGNGTLVHSPDGAILHEALLDVDLAIGAIRIARAVHITPIVYSGAGLVTDSWDDGVDLLMAHHEPAPVVVPDLESALRETYPPNKIVFMNTDDLDEVVIFQSRLERDYGRQAQILRSGLSSLVELLPMGATKGTALAYVLGHLGISSEQVIAFGDNFNDVDMIRHAGLGVAMANGPEAVQSAADYVTATNDQDGVAQALRRFVLNVTPCSD